MSNASTNANPESGFTLVETLAALAIVGLLMTSLAGGLQLIASSRDRMVDSMDVQDGLLRGLHVARRDITGIQRLFWPAGEQRQFRFLGTADSLHMVTLEPPYPTAPGPYYVRYRIAANSHGAVLMRDRAPFDFERNGFASVAFADRVALLDGPYRMRFSYGDGRAPSGMSWLARWPFSDRLPDLVRLEVVSAADGTPAFPALIAAPNAQAERACILEQSKDCTVETGRKGAQQEAKSEPASAEVRDGR